MGGGLSTLTGNDSGSAKQFEIATNPIAHTSEIGDKLDETMGINDLVGVQLAYHLETRRLQKRRDDILARITGADTRASKAVRDARTKSTRQAGRSSTILSR